MEIVLATTNPHKMREFKEMFKLVPQHELISLRWFSDYLAPEETEQTFEGNAQLKAIHAAKHLKKWVLADDSGLVVPALQGAPGVYSRRYAGPDASDEENRNKLLEDMKHLDEEKRAAYYECSLVLANPEGVQKSVVGKCEGMIVFEPKGRNGFGYDPLFIKHDYDKTFAQIDEEVKNRISHRRKAFERLLNFLDSLPNVIQ